MSAKTIDALNVLTCLSYESIRKHTLRLRPYDLMRRKHGKRVADQKCGETGAGVVTTYPLQRVEIDHFLVDAYVKVKIDYKYYSQRPWLTVALDHYSGAVISYYLSLSPPSAISVLGVLRVLIAPSKERLSRIPSHGVVFAGIPDAIAVDNGRDLTSQAVSDACFQAGIEILYMPPRAPRWKGCVERSGGTTNTRFIHWIPGTTLGKQMAGLQYDAAAHAKLTYEQFEERLPEYFDLHNQTPRRTKPGTPAQRWVRGTERVPPRIPMSYEDFDATIALTFPRTPSQSGIGFEGLHYNNTQLWNVWQTLSREKRKKGETHHRQQQLTVRLNPLDIRHVYVFDPANNTRFRVDCTTELPYPPTLEYHRAVNKVMKATNSNPHDVKARTKAAHTLYENLKRDAAESKGTLRGKKASLARAVEKAKQMDEKTLRTKRASDKDGNLDDLLNQSRDDTDE